MMTQLWTRFFSLPLLIAALCAVALSGIARPASAQPVRSAAPPTESGLAPMPEVWQLAIGYQLARTLVSPVHAQRSRAFQLTTYCARYRPEVDLTPVVPVLLEIYRTDPEERYRLAAVAALHAIGDETAMQQVRRHALNQPSRVVQYVSLNVLVDFYGARTFTGDVAAAARAEQLRETILLAQQQRGEAVATRRKQE